MSELIYTCQACNDQTTTPKQDGWVWIISKGDKVSLRFPLCYLCAPQKETTSD